MDCMESNNVLSEDNCEGNQLKLVIDLLRLVDVVQRAKSAAEHVAINPEEMEISSRDKTSIDEDDAQVCLTIIKIELPNLTE